MVSKNMYTFTRWNCPCGYGFITKVVHDMQAIYLKEENVRTIHLTKRVSCNTIICLSLNMTQ